MNVSVTSLEPGDAFVVSATSVPTLGGTFRLKLGKNATECHHGTLFLGGNAVASVRSADQPHLTAGTPGQKPEPHEHGDIPAVTRIIPTNITSGVWYLCWNQTATDYSSVPKSITIV
ncbi:MAG: hypothetical protein ABR540_09180 [Acidimicrobiales bacterium]